MKIDPATPISSRVLLKLLEERFPDVLGKGVVRPLKIGILDDVVVAYEGKYTKADLARAISQHTRRRRYRKSLIEGAARYDLDGRVAGVVSKEEEAQAGDVLTKQWKEASSARARRRKVVKKIQASGLTPHEYATREGLEESAVRSDYDKGLYEQRTLQARHQKKLGESADLTSSACPPLTK